MNFTIDETIESLQTSNREIQSYHNIDHQGINWEVDIPFSRKVLRLRRRLTYSSFKNIMDSSLTYSDPTLNFKCKFFDFLTSHPVKVEYKHFQLRKNIQCANSEEIYTKVKSNKIAKYNPITKTQEVISSPLFEAVSFSVYQNLLLVGGMEGELMLQSLDNTLKFSKVITDAPSRITNCVSMFEDQSGLNLLVCNNDHQIRIIDPETQAEKLTIGFEECVNCEKVSTDQKKIAVCLDSCSDLIVDKQTGERLYELKGHSDYGFCADWDPSNEYLLATGNQDKSLMIWDIRQGSELTPVQVFQGKLGSILSTKYTKNGKYLMFCESADFLNVIDKRNYTERQCIDYFGEISGFDVCEDNRELRIYLGLADPSFQYLIELKENSMKFIDI